MTPLIAAIPSPPRNTIDIGPLTIYVYGLLIGIGVVVAVVVARRRYERFGGDGPLIERLAVWAVVIGFLGARAGYVSTHLYRFEGRPWAVLFIWEGGLALYGGLTAGALTVIFLARRWRGDVFAIGDAVAVGVPLAQAIGRWGNWFNQELFGTPTDLPWGLRIAPQFRPPQFADFELFHPTFLYESLWNLLLTVPVILWMERRGRLAKGASFPLYLVVYGTGRFLMELLRTDTVFRLFGISRNGWISLGAVIGGLIALAWFQRRGEERTLLGEPSLLAPGQPTATPPMEAPVPSPSDGSLEEGATDEA